jgi:hypothetical protein
MTDNDTPRLGRRQVLRTIGAGTAVGVGGLGMFTGTAAAWDRKDVDFKGCSEVWLVVGANDIAYDPPAVARVVVALPDGSTDCRDVEITADNTTSIPGQYGDAPVRKIMVNDGEKMLGVIFYNYRSVDRFSSPSCIHTNDHRCASTPGTPSLEDADCVQTARENDGYDCTTTESDRGGDNGRGRDGGDNGQGRSGRDDKRGRGGSTGRGRGRRFDRTQFRFTLSNLFDRFVKL